MFVELLDNEYFRISKHSEYEPTESIILDMKTIFTRAVADYRLDGRCLSPGGQKRYIFYLSRTTLKSTHIPIGWVIQIPSQQLKSARHEVWHFALANAVEQNAAEKSLYKPFDSYSIGPRFEPRRQTDFCSSSHGFL